MAHARPLICNWTAGELSPRMHGRVDLDQYQAGAASIVNFLVLPQGGITRRSGTCHVCPTKGNQPVRLVPFIASTAAAYVLVFGPFYLHVIRNRALLMAGGVPMELPTPYAPQHLRELSFAQSADVLYIAHGSYAPRKLTRTGANTFTLARMEFEDGPYSHENTGDTGIEIGGTTTTGSESPPPVLIPMPATGGGEGDGGGNGSEGGESGGESDGGDGEGSE